MNNKFNSHNEVISKFCFVAKLLIFERAPSTKFRPIFSAAFVHSTDKLFYTPSRITSPYYVGLINDSQNLVRGEVRMGEGGVLGLKYAEKYGCSRSQK
jgi:hypothetical protein